MRNDLSNYLVHWTKGNTYEDAYNILKKICFDGYILGGSRGVIDHKNVVCFTEAPANLFHSDVIGEFKPFGVQIEKRTIFRKGGLPVIYQPDNQLNLLSDEIKWRHVSFSIDNSAQNRNYTWQREWRLKTERLILDPFITVIVPNNKWADKLRLEIFNEDLFRGWEDHNDIGCYYTYRPVLNEQFTILCLE